MGNKNKKDKKTSAAAETEKTGGDGEQSEMPGDDEEMTDEERQQEAARQAELAEEHHKVKLSLQEAKHKQQTVASILINLAESYHEITNGFCGGILRIMTLDPLVQETLGAFEKHVLKGEGGSGSQQEEATEWTQLLPSTVEGKIRPTGDKETGDKTDETETQGPDVIVRNNMKTMEEDKQLIEDHMKRDIARLNELGRGWAATRSQFILLRPFKLKALIKATIVDYDIPG